MKMRLSSLSVTIALLLEGCAVGPRYVAPRPAMPAKFSEVARNDPMAAGSRPVGGVEAVTRWWLVFEDPELSSLVDRATRGNVGLQQAVSRVREARAQRAMSAAGLLPQLAATATYNRGHGSKNVVLPIGGSGAGSSGASASPAQARAEATASASSAADPPGDAPSSAAGGAGGSPFGQGGFPGVTTNLYQVGFDASWELDIFGGTRRAIEAANAGVAAAEEAQRAAQVSLLAEVATVYFELRTVQQRLALARANLAAQRDTLGIVEAKLKTGFASDLDVAQQRAQVSSTAASLPAVEAAERDAMHTLAWLVGESPEALGAELAARTSLANLPAQVPVGLPSDLLRRRPDIRRAERELAQATAQVGVATADLFPRFNLMGAFGLDSSAAKHLADRQSQYYSLTPAIRWPILDWGKIRANVRVENERQQQAFLAYQNAVLQALKEVEDALVHYEKEQVRRADLAAALDASRRSRELAQQRYEHGVSDLLTTLETQRALLQAEDAVTQSDGALRRDLVALYKALGGGWEQNPP